MSEFSGKGHPEDHSEKYELLMIGMGHNDIMLCKIFKTYLKGSASMWYKSLKPRSIRSYEQLKKKFLKYYSHLCRKEKDTEALVHFRQRTKEELGDYLARFKEEDGMVTNLDKVKAMGFLTAGLDPYKGSDRRDAGKEGRKETDRGAKWHRDRDSSVLTPLNAPISKILHEIKGKPGFFRPAKMKVPNHKNNPDKYYDYHRDKGHNIDECYHLKKLIERMIKDGELNQSVRDLRDRLGPKENQEEEVKILFHKTYCKMNLAGEQLEPCNEAPLYAIGGHPIQFEGTITLHVLLGKLPYTVEKPVKFYGNRIESLYNAIFELLVNL
ncbi:uncharacterized protein LOC141685760 [Apium graveolens]|uniref:uncharacterized protein LOC141685760 n=1 Tax=Apium graveolens TaxID=4045 RepID=UPI003D7B44D4